MKIKKLVFDEKICVCQYIIASSTVCIFHDFSSNQFNIFIRNRFTKTAWKFILKREKDTHYIRSMHYFLVIKMLNYLARNLVCPLGQ